MALSAFDGRNQEPRPPDLERVLGRSAARWEELLAHLTEDFAPLTVSWNFAGANWGWSLRAARKKRTILYLAPRAKHFLAGFAWGRRRWPRRDGRTCRRMS